MYCKNDFDAFPTNLCIAKVPSPMRMLLPLMSRWITAGSLVWRYSSPSSERMRHALQWLGETNSSREIPRTYILHTGCYCNLENQTLQILQHASPLVLLNISHMYYWDKNCWFSSLLEKTTRDHAVIPKKPWAKFKRNWESLVSAMAFFPIPETDPVNHFCRAAKVCRA